MVRYKNKYFWNFITISSPSSTYVLLLDSNGEKIFDSHTQTYSRANNSSHTTKEIDFTTKINPAHIYSFHVYLKTLPKEITVGGISHNKQSESLHAIVKCYSRPSPPLG